MAPAKTRDTESVNARILCVQTSFAQYEREWQLQDLDQSIVAAQDALKACQNITESTVQMQQCRFHLSIALGSRYAHIGDAQDLDEQINLLRDCLFDDESKMALCVCELGAALRTRYSQANDLKDLEEARTLHDISVSSSLEGSEVHRRALLEKGCTQIEAYRKWGGPDRLDYGIELLKTNLPRECTSDAWSVRARATLGAALGLKHMLNGDKALLQESISVYRKMLTDIPEQHRDRYLAHQGLGICLNILFEHTGDSAYLDESITHHRAVMMDGYRARPGGMRRAIGTAIALRLRYHRLAMLEDLEEAISLLRGYLESSSPIYINLSAQLATSLMDRFKVLADDDNLDEAIAVQRRILGLLPYSHPHHCLTSGNLAVGLELRYGRRKDINDLNESVKLLRRTLDTQEKGSVYSTVWTFHLARTLSLLHRATKSTDALSEALERCQGWLNKPRAQETEEHYRGVFLSTTASVLMLRYNFCGEVQDLNSVVMHLEEALGLSTSHENERLQRMIRLAAALRKRGSETRNNEDIQRALILLNQALVLLPDEHPDRTLVFSGFSQILLLNDTPNYDIDKALDYLSQALHNSNTNVQERISSAMDVLQNPTLQQAEVLTRELQTKLLNAYKRAIALLPRMVYFGLNVEARLRVLSDTDRLAADGCFFALAVGHPNLAVELLDHGRALFWYQHLRFRTAFEDLPPETYKELRLISGKLDQGSQETSSAIGSDAHDNKASHETELTEQRRLEEKFEHLVEEIRGLPGFSRFLLPETFEVLSTAAARGPIVVLLASARGSAIILIQADCVCHERLSDGLDATLSKLSRKVSYAVKQGRKAVVNRPIAHRRREEPLDQILDILWREVGQKIVAKLQLSKEDQDRPRLTLCPTGIFSHLPVHASGMYAADSSIALADFCVMSYTPTLGALLTAQRKSAGLPFRKIKTLLTAVTRPAKWSWLPFAGVEVEAVRQVLPPGLHVEVIRDAHKGSEEGLEEPDIAVVLSKLRDANILHLACHGYQDPNSPLNSGFIMKDGMLTVSKLMGLNLQHAYLAFLSACETAKGDRSQPDQAIHLAATMLFAGFCSVIGTMWSMNDVDGPEVATMVYQELFNESAQEVLDLDRVPFALNKAVKKLRESGFSASRWAPYVHIGA